MGGREELVGEDPTNNKKCGQGKEKQLSDGRLDKMVKRARRVGSGGIKKGWRDEPMEKGGEERTTRRPHDLSLKLAR